MIYKYEDGNKKSINDGFNVVNVYNDKTSNFDYTVVNLEGEHGLCSNNKSIKYWLIINGSAKVYLDDLEYEVSQGDFIVINKNIKHNIIGKVKFAVFCNPSFDASAETYY